MRDFIIHGCDIETADDAIAIKSSEYSRSCEAEICARVRRGIPSSWLIRTQPSACWITERRGPD